MAEVIYLSEKQNPDIPDYIDAIEIFDMMMLNLMHKDRDSIIVKFVNANKRRLTRLAVEFLARRGFTSSDISQIPETVSDEIVRMKALALPRA